MQIIDVTEANFQSDILKASMQHVVILDAWAPWCQPCKEMLPRLETILEAYGDTFLFAKMNVDENQQLAQMLRVQSVPMVYALYQGQPIDVLQGSRPDSEIKTFLDGVIEKSGIETVKTEDNFDDALSHAQSLNSSGDFTGAKEIFETVLDELKDDNETIKDQTLIGLSHSLMGLRDLDKASEILNNISDAGQKNDNYRGACAALDLNRQAEGNGIDSEALLKKLDKNQDDFQVRFDLALALFLTHAYQDAFDHLLYIIKKDRAWQDDAARKQLLKFFEQLGFADSDAKEGRKKLSIVLFS